MALIRKAKVEDYKEVIELFKKFVENPKRYGNEKNNSFKKFLKQKNSWMYLATVNKKIVGYITFTIRTVVRYGKPILEVEEFFVLEEYRRMKIGTDLMNKALSTAKKKNCEMIFLASGGKGREAAVKFYTSKGYDKYAYHFRIKP